MTLLASTRFPGVPLKPLEHLSIAAQQAAVYELQNYPFSAYFEHKITSFLLSRLIFSYFHITKTLTTVATAVDARHATYGKTPCETRQNAMRKAASRLVKGGLSQAGRRHIGIETKRLDFISTCYIKKHFHAKASTNMFPAMTGLTPVTNQASLVEEYPLGVGRRRGGHFVFADAVALGQTLQHVQRERALVALAAHRHGGHVGRVGLKHYA